MWKNALIAAAAVAVVGSSVAVAQQRTDRPAEPPRAQHWRPSAEDLGALIDARLAALKAGLRLTPEQDKTWPAFEQAYRGLSQLSVTRRLQARDGQPDSADVVARLQGRADAVMRQGIALKQLADATAPLYQSLDDGQKRRFLMLSHMTSPGQYGAHWRERHGYGERGMRHHGFDGPGMMERRMGDRRSEGRGEERGVRRLGFERISDGVPEGQFDAAR